MHWYSPLKVTSWVTRQIHEEWMGIDVNAIAEMVFGKALGYITPELGIVFTVIFGYLMHVFSFVIFEQRQLDGLWFDELELHHSLSWPATLVVSSGLFWHPHWIQVWKEAFHSGDNYKFSARWHFKVAMGITMQHVFWAVKIISNRLKKCKEKPMV